MKIQSQMALDLFMGTINIEQGVCKVALFVFTEFR